VGAGLVAGLVLGILLAGGGTGGSGPTPASGAAARAAPNFVVVMSDDQSLASFRRRYMPQTFHRIVDHGTEFTHGIAAPPECCPSRAGFLTGEYPHNHGVTWNSPGFPMLLEPGNILPAWLQADGYRTALIGKYLNKYSKLHGTTPAPGWSDWFDVMEQPLYYGARISDNGVEQDLDSQTYLTDVLNSEAVSFIDSAAGSSQPFFLWLAQYAPHPRQDRDSTRAVHCRGLAPVPAPGDYAPFQDAVVPKPPNYDERNVADKPPPISERPPLNDRSERIIEKNWRCGLGALQDVDRGVGGIVDALRENGVLNNTVIVYFSDNAVYYGNHRIVNGKVQPYEEALRIPYAIRVPRAVLGTQPASRVTRPVTQFDLTPTILSLAGADACTAGDECREMDGRSVAGLLGSDGKDWPAHRGVLVELTPPDRCGYQALRTSRFAYIERSTGTPGACSVTGRELYDLVLDPYELHNLASRDPARAETLSAHLAQLAGCKGIAGRDAEPGPTGYCE
jgi:N-acetylglucosamine-6-sulfatase